MTAPIVTIDALTEISASTNLQSYAVSGNCSEASVSVVVDASGVSPATHPICGASSNGKWSTTVDISALGGTVFFNAQQVDIVGNRGSASGRTIEVVRLYFEYQTLAVGGGHSCAVTKDKKVLCWGKDSMGQLGNGSITGAKNYSIYVHESESSSGHLTSMVQVKSGKEHTCALSTARKVYCWGRGHSGQLGSSNQGVNRFAPRAVLTQNGGASVIVKGGTLLPSLSELLQPPMIAKVRAVPNTWKILN